MVAPVELIEDVFVVVLPDLIDRLGQPAKLTLRRLGEVGEQGGDRWIAGQDRAGRVARPRFEQIRRQIHPSWLRYGCRCGESKSAGTDKNRIRPSSRSSTPSKYRIISPDRAASAL